MSGALIPVSPSEYRFDAPCFVYGGELRAFDDPACWQSESAWLASLANLVDVPDALVIPMELPSSARNRQDLLGYDLLCVLRWSSSEALRGRPVLLAAWQPLQDVLRKRPDVLVVRPAVEFIRLPDAVYRLPGFLSDVAAGLIPPATSDEIEAVSAADQQAVTIWRTIITQRIGSRKDMSPFFAPQRRLVFLRRRMNLGRWLAHVTIGKTALKRSFGVRPRSWR